MRYEGWDRFYSMFGCKFWGKGNESFLSLQSISNGRGGLCMVGYDVIWCEITKIASAYK
jgi:hypothetical protein